MPGCSGFSKANLSNKNDLIRTLQQRNAELQNKPEDSAKQTPQVAVPEQKEPHAEPVKPPLRATPAKLETQVKQETPKIGSDNTLVGVPNPPSMGSGNTIIGPTDSRGNTIINRGGTAIGNGAAADPTSIAIGAGARAGVGPVTVQPGGAALFGQQGGVTAGQFNVFGTDFGPIRLTASQTGSTVTIQTNRRIDLTSIGLILDKRLIYSHHQYDATSIASREQD